MISFNQLSRDGLCIVPGFLSAQSAFELSKIMHASTGMIAAAEGSVPELSESYAMWTGLGLAPLRGFLADSNSALLAKLDAVLREVIVEGYWLRLDFSFFRQCSLAAKGHVAWHCDAEAASMMTFERPGLTVWMPLEEVGEKLPSLELIRGSNLVMRERDDLQCCYHREDAWVDQVPGERIAPKITNLGDAIAFSPFTLHRTQRIVTDQIRHSVEFRFVLQ